MSAPSVGWLVRLAEADPADVGRLGGKGASLAAMSRLGLPVPAAFILSTELCAEFSRSGEIDPQLWTAVEEALPELGEANGRSFGSPEVPLLVSVRSGAPVSMPGMMDTILNVGLSHSTIPGLAQMTGDEDFAWDSYMRLLRMFGNSVRGLPAPALAAARLGAEREGGGAKAAAAALEAAIESESGSPFPGDPRDQLRESIEAVLRSWQSPRAQRYRRHADIDEDLGTAVVVQAMVFGNLDQTSGSGVAFTRDPGSGEPNMYGDFLAGAQGEDVVSGEYDTGGLGECREHAPAAYQELIAAGAALERLFTDMCDIEFTIERGRLWVLQARVGQRTGLAEVRIAADLLEEGLIGTETALARISPAGLLRVAARVFDPAAERDLLGKGVPASPGAAVGVIATSSRSAEEFAAAGRPAILVRPETSPDDIAGFISAAGIVTARGGRASHAAVVARGLNRPATCGVESLRIEGETVWFGSRSLAEGEPVSVDGDAGLVLAGEVPTQPPRLGPQVVQLMEQCDSRRRIPVLATEPAEWADRVVDPETLVRCSDPEGVAAADAAILIDPGAADDPAALLVAAAGRDGATFVLVDVRWPSKLSRLPDGNWNGVIADWDGRLAARLLAAIDE